MILERPVTKNIKLDFTNPLCWDSVWDLCKYVHLVKFEKLTNLVGKP